ncbi:AtpZ/AtpI family protein [Actibacterium sp. 188UL27-1]|uniref:AtpZ/AtpI family protein n=1 Tax=Actibacterium sp. 188UL27-1 TaxID=2786961 RepID=UPI001957DFA7|nr:AtpZ/AtpI family protein [Actibacterium sp. 188UL27-1]MBM7069511.1 AtpZ/AtpI family protein [Actibacterium sp. 188UL27-1]
MSDPHDADRLRKLEDRIDALKETQAPQPRADEHYSQAQAGWRMVTELVAGLLIGFSIGYGLDVLFGTLPILLVLFTLLGFAAGVRVMLRTAQEIQSDAVDRAITDKDATEGEKD